ncbi:MAG TPA: saccharopine dehydrogenase NADP-binding domain-containing protein [Anaerolineales bacterium]
MSPGRFLILGGYGQTGALIARYLLAESDVEILLAGRNLDKAQTLASRLNADFETQRVQGISVDASCQENLIEALQAVDLLIVASSTAQYASAVAVAALQAGVDYLDVQYSQDKLRALKTMAADIEAAGLCFITEAGFHPGLPAALVRYVSQCFDRLDAAHVSSVIKVDWRALSLSPETLEEFVREIQDYDSRFYKGARWRKARMAGMLDYRVVDFGSPFGRQYVVPMMFDEMLAIPEMFPSLDETGFYISGFNWFVDGFVFPLSAIALQLTPRAVGPMAHLLRFGLDRFSRPPYGVVLKVEARGEKDGDLREVELYLRHPDGYAFTAIPVVACLLQYMDGRADKPGLWMMGHLVEPNRLLQDMQRMGVQLVG